MKKKCEFDKNFQISLDNYKKNFQSDHWLFNNRKKKNLFKYKNLSNFRKNGLSEGLDDKFYTKKKTKKLFTLLKKNYGEKTLLNLLEKNNIGNPKNFLKRGNYFFTAHELVHIKHLLDFKKKINLSKKNTVCEIGPGYGSLISKIIKIYKSKVILIDLPEANYLSHYYLKKIYPKKKFLLSSEIKKKISKQDILKNDIIILCPWDLLPNIKIDFFINSRSMMEMNYETINYYFKLIVNKIKKNGYFLCINRYYKDTVGYPIEFKKYPFDNKWKVLISKKSWQQKHIHYLLLKRSKKMLNDIEKEIDKISIFTSIAKKEDPFFVRRILPNPVYNFYKHFKFNLKNFFNE